MQEMKHWNNPKTAWFYDHFSSDEKRELALAIDRLAVAYATHATIEDEEEYRLFYKHVDLCERRVDVRGLIDDIFYAKEAAKSCEPMTREQIEKIVAQQHLRDFGRTILAARSRRG